MSKIPDPFREKRNSEGVLACEFQGENVPMILRHEEVRKAAKDWKTFSSDAPFRVPIPSEEDVRTMRQLPVETDPPDHTDYRKIVEPFFLRAKDPAVIAHVEALIEGMLSEAMRRDSTEIVREFALPIQSRALAYLLNVPESEATPGSAGVSMCSGMGAQKDPRWRLISTDNLTAGRLNPAKISSAC